jgi:hypothetical protein
MASANPVSLEPPTIEFPEAGITWAGEGPFEDGGFCFGTDDGQLWYATDEFNRENAPLLVDDSRGPINGVAFTPGKMAVSTPERIVFFRRSQAGLTGKRSIYEGDVRDVQVAHLKRWSGLMEERAIHEGGAHGIIATPNGGVIAPLGQLGLLLNEPDAQGNDRRWEISPKDGLYYYKVACLGTNDKNENVFACGCREGGVIALALPSGRESGRVVVHPRPSSYRESYDIVDVLGLNSKSLPFAALGLSIDNSLHYSPDILHQRFRTFKFPAMNGTAYSIFASGGHIFILTSESIYACVGLADRLLSGEDLGGGNAVSRLDVDVVEGFLAYGKYLLLAEAGAVRRLDLEMWAKLPSFKPESQSSHMPNGHPSVLFEESMESVLELDSTGLGPPTDHSFPLINVA